LNLAKTYMALQFDAEQQHVSRLTFAYGVDLTWQCEAREVEIGRISICDWRRHRVAAAGASAELLLPVLAVKPHLIHAVSCQIHGNFVSK
jgi:hypothetical protein